MINCLTVQLILRCSISFRFPIHLSINAVTESPTQSTAQMIFLFMIESLIVSLTTVPNMSRSWPRYIVSILSVTLLPSVAHPQLWHLTIRLAAPVLT